MSLPLLHMELNIYVSFICDKKNRALYHVHWSQLPDDMIYALSTSYDKYSFI